MYDYINGVVSVIHSNSITLVNNGIGYLIYTANPYQFKENEKYKIFVYQKVAEDENTLYGFKTDEERALFLKLINLLRT